MTGNNKCHITVHYKHISECFKMTFIEYSFIASKKNDYVLKNNLKIDISVLNTKLIMFYFHFVLSISLYNLPWIDK